MRGGCDLMVVQLPKVFRSDSGLHRPGMYTHQHATFIASLKHIANMAQIVDSGGESFNGGHDAVFHQQARGLGDADKKEKWERTGFRTKGNDFINCLFSSAGQEG